MSVRRIPTSLVGIVAVAAAIAACPGRSQAVDLTGRWDVRSRGCSASTAGADDCGPTAPGILRIQMLDSYRFLLSLGTTGPADMKCALASTPDGGGEWACAGCVNTRNFYQTLEVDDQTDELLILAGIVRSADRMKGQWVSAISQDTNIAPGVQPGVGVIISKWTAKRVDSVAPGLTDCSTP